MKKQKVYFGKNRGVKMGVGRDRNWAVPRMLRRYFELRLTCALRETSAKMAINSTYGAKANRTAVSAEVVEAALERRKNFKKGMLGELSIPQMEKLLKDTSLLHHQGL